MRLIARSLAQGADEHFPGALLPQRAFMIIKRLMQPSYVLKAALLRRLRFP
jgi:hypothetical protein